MNRSEAVDAFMANLSHPLKAEVELVRTAILSADDRAHEEIKWNAPSFFIGEHFATFNLRSQEAVQVVLHTGAKKKEKTNSFEIDDPTNLLDWKSPDRAVASFSGPNEVPAGIAPFEAILHEWIEQAGVR